MFEVIKLIAITFLPFLELRASIPYGIFSAKMHWITVFFICIIANIVVGLIIYFLLEWVIKLLTYFPPIARIWNRYVERTQAKIHAGVEKYGEWAVAVFIGIPLPGSGVYSGALASFLIGLGFRKFVVANILGVLIAGVLVTIASLTGSEILSIFLKN